MSHEDEAMAKILIVDDLPDNSRLLAHLVKDQGHEASVASNGRQALDIAEAERPDVILLDVMMPEMDGIEVCRRLKADEELRMIPVILVTAKDLDEDVVRGLDAGADDYVTKPFNREVLAARLRSAIRLKQSYDAVMRTQRGTAARGETADPDGIRSSCERATLPPTPRGSDHLYLFCRDRRRVYPYRRNTVSDVRRQAAMPRKSTPPTAYLWLAMVYPDDREMVDGHIARVLKGENVPPLVHRIFHKDGGVRWVRDTIVPHYNSAGQLVRYDGLVKTSPSANWRGERRKKDEQLREAQKLEAVGLLAGGIAHEFNNLLQVIGGYTTCAMEDLSPQEQRYKDLQQVRTATDRAATLTRQLLGFSRRRILQPDNVDPNQLVDDLAQMLRPLVGDRISVEVDLREDIGTVYADPGELQQALLNLCLNARDAMPSGGTLLLSTDTVILE